MEVICLDTDILIDYGRAKENAKDKTKLVQLSSEYKLSVSVIVAFELLRNDDSIEDKFWNNFFNRITILDMDLVAAEIAGGIYRDLKLKGTMIGIEDILIAAVAIKNNFKLATNNQHHFSRIKGLKLL